MAPQLAWMQSRCVGCGLCETVCTSGVHGHGDARKTVDFEKCVGCGECVAACPSAALEMMGKWVTPEEVLEEVERDMPFYANSGGGMTLSGGEPAMQPEFAAHLLREAKKRGIHTAMETAGHMPWQVSGSFYRIWIWFYLTVSKWTAPFIRLIPANRIRLSMRICGISAVPIALLRSLCGHL